MYIWLYYKHILDTYTHIHVRIDVPFHFFFFIPTIFDHLWNSNQISAKVLQDQVNIQYAANGKVSFAKLQKSLDVLTTLDYQVVQKQKEAN